MPSKARKLFTWHWRLEDTQIDLWCIIQIEDISIVAKEYVELAQAHHVQMSMTEHSDPYENALAERMNRTLKEEFCLDQILQSRAQASAITSEAIELYNTYRPHLALNGRTPNEVHEKPR